MDNTVVKMEVIITVYHLQTIEDLESFNQNLEITMIV